MFLLSSITRSCVADGEVSTCLSSLVQKNEMSVYKSFISIILFAFCGTEMRGSTFVSFSKKLINVYRHHGLFAVLSACF